MIFYNFKKLKMFWNERGKCPKVSDAVCFSPRLPISQIGQNEKLLSLISICVAASGEQSQHKKDNIYHNYQTFFRNKYSCDHNNDYWLIEIEDDLALSCYYTSKLCFKSWASLWAHFGMQLAQSKSIFKNRTRV